jgi:hypothetical protein
MSKKPEYINPFAGINMPISEGAGVGSIELGRRCIYEGMEVQSRTSIA